MRPALLATLALLALMAQAPDAVRYVDVALDAGLRDIFYCGGERTKNYIIETLGSGVAFIDYDNDGNLDIFAVNGSRLEGFPKGQEPTNHLYRNEGHVLEHAVSFVAIEMIRRLLPLGKSLQPRPVHREDIQIAVVIVVDERHAGAERLDDVILRPLAAAVEDVPEPGIERHVDVSNRVRSLGHQRKQRKRCEESGTHLLGLLPHHQALLRLNARQS